MGNSNKLFDVTGFKPETSLHHGLKTVFEKMVHDSKGAPEKLFS
jgi:hypothetical protein